jgi:hypothetical protein
MDWHGAQPCNDNLWWLQGTRHSIQMQPAKHRADYVLAVKHNQPKLAESITTFYLLRDRKNRGMEEQASHIYPVGGEGSRSAGGQILLGRSPS